MNIEKSRRFKKRDKLFLDDSDNVKLVKCKVILYIITKFTFELEGREELMKEVLKYDKRKNEAMNLLRQANMYFMGIME
jgi:hypothetical protein